MEKIAEFLKNAPPEQVAALDLKWKNFREKNQVPNFPSEIEFLSWARDHGVSDVPGDVRSGFLISKFREDQLKRQAQQQQEDAASAEEAVQPATPPAQSPASLFAPFAGLPLVPSFFGNKAELMDHDDRFIKIVDKKKKEWLTKNPGKDFLSKEGLDYIYGPLNIAGKSPLQQEAEKEFREDPRNKKRVAKYDRIKAKIQKNPENDLGVYETRNKIQAEFTDRKKQLKKEGVKLSRDEEEKLFKDVERKHWGGFSEEHSVEKVNAYRGKISELDEVVKIKSDEELIKKLEARDKPTTPASHTEPSTPHAEEHATVHTSHTTPAASTQEAARHAEAVKPTEPVHQVHVQTVRTATPGAAPGTTPGATVHQPRSRRRTLGFGNFPSFFGNVSNPVQMIKKSFWKNPAVIMGGIILLFALLLVTVLKPDSFGVPGFGGGGSSTSPTTTGPGSGGPPVSGGTGGSIAACMFYRGQAKPPAQQFKSPTLIGYIENAANLSGVPASVIGAVARVETQSLSDLTDETLPSYKCPESVDGALGPLQVVAHFSHRTDAICRECIDTGAKLLGKTVDSLTREDYCDLKTGMVLGAGFILKKMQYNFRTSTPTWDKSWTTNKDAMYALAKSFYGALTYGKSGEFNYGEDVWNSVSSCRPQVASINKPPPGTIPPTPQDIRQGIIDSFGITMNGFDQEHLQWAWETFWQTSNTNFPTLIKGSVIVATDTSSQVGCPGDPIAVRLGQYTPGDFFKFILTHELGHVIQSCVPRNKAYVNEAMNAYNTEGGISFYGKNANSCNKTVNWKENYADVIAYYLHPQAGLGSAPKSCGGPSNPPNPFFSGQTNFPLHLQVGENILKAEPNI